MIQNRISFLLISFLISISYGAFAAAADPILLSQARTQLKPPHYTTAQKQLVIDQATLIFRDLYVHRELKLQDFGAAADPLPRLASLRQQAATLDDVTFHTTMEQIFIDLHDHHTNYVAPLPLRCSGAISPMLFVEAWENNQPGIFLKSYSKRLKASFPAAIDALMQKVSPGDELVSVDGVSATDHIATLLPWSGGANEDAQLTGATDLLAMRMFSEMPIPTENSRVLKFKSRSSSQLTTVTVPWYAIVNSPGCVAEAKGQNPQNTLLRPRHHGATISDVQENPRRKFIRDWFPAPELTAPFDSLQTLGVPGVFTSSRFQTPAGDLGYIMLESFMPNDPEMNAEWIVSQFKTLVERDFAGTTAIVIDVRDNGGGNIKIAEEMVQLFTPKEVLPGKVRLLPTDLNRQIFLKSNDNVENGWTGDIAAAQQSNAKYTNPRPITTESQANRYGQAYFKPVVILTNARCYSACDLFSALMQDHAAAKVIGQDKHTGAGGANVMEYDAFRQILGNDNPANPIKVLPGYQSFRVSWRQSIRSGLNGGKLLEDQGVLPDALVRRTPNDITSENQDTMHAIHQFIDQMAPDYTHSIKLTSSLLMANGAPAQWTEQVTDVDRVELQFNGQVLKTWDSLQGTQTLTVTPNLTGTWEDKSLTLVGYKDGTPSLRVTREVMWRGSYFNASESQDGFDAEVTSSTAGKTKFYTLQGSVDDGWKVVGNVLRIGNGPKYKPLIRSRAFVPVDISHMAHPAIGIKVKAELEQNMDMLSIIAQNPDTGERQYLITIDNNVNTNNQPYPFQLPKGWKRADVVLEFESDENWNLGGPEISQLIVVDQDLSVNNLPQ